MHQVTDKLHSWFGSKKLHPRSDTNMCSRSDIWDQIYRRRATCVSESSLQYGCSSSSSVFQERLKSGTREFNGDTQVVNSNINKDGSVYCSHDPQKAQSNSLNYKHILYWYR